MIALQVWIFRPDSVVDLCSGRLLASPTLCMKLGSQSDKRPVVVRGIVIVACSVGGSRTVSPLLPCDLRALTAAILADVAAACANGALIRDDGLKRSLMPDELGS